MSDAGQSARRIGEESPLAPASRVLDRAGHARAGSVLRRSGKYLRRPGKLTNESPCDFSESFAASIEAIRSGQIDELEEGMAQMASFLANLAWLQQQQGWYRTFAFRDG